MSLISKISKKKLVDFFLRHLWRDDTTENNISDIEKKSLKGKWDGRKIYAITLKACSKRISASSMDVGNELTLPSICLDRILQ